MVREIEMLADNDYKCPCVIQYVIFPPHLCKEEKLRYEQELFVVSCNNVSLIISNIVRSTPVVILRSMPPIGEAANVNSLQNVGLNLSMAYQLDVLNRVVISRVLTSRKSQMR